MKRFLKDILQLGAAFGFGFAALTVGSEVLAGGGFPPPVLQHGSVSSGHCAQWNGNNSISDAGAACSGGSGTVTNVATGGLVTGGPITTTGTISLSNIGSGDVVGNNTTGSAAPVDATLTSIFDQAYCNVQGSILYRGATSWACLPPGTSGYVLSSQGASANPHWIAGGGSGTVTSIATTAPITGGTITTTGTIGVSVASSSATGVVKGDGATLSINGSGVISCSTATSSQLGCVEPDGTIITDTSGAITVAKATSSAFGVAECGNGITCTTGVISTTATQNLTPQGRLTLSSTNAIQTSDITAAGTIYYLPYNGQNVFVYNGTNFTQLSIGSSISLTLNSTDMPSTQVYDIYVTNQSGTPTLCSMYWGSNTSRSTTAGGKSGTANASITQVNGVWVNNAAIASSNCYNNTTSYAISANQGTLLGTYYTTAGGQTAMMLKPSAAAGGGANVLGLYNAYNRVKLQALSRDSTTSWNYPAPAGAPPITATATESRSLTACSKACFGHPTKAPGPVRRITRAA